MSIAPKFGGKVFITKSTTDNVPPSPAASTPTPMTTTLSGSVAGIGAIRSWGSESEEGSSTSNNIQSSSSIGGGGNRPWSHEKDTGTISAGRQSATTTGQSRSAAAMTSSLLENVKSSSSNSKSFGGIGNATLVGKKSMAPAVAGTAGMGQISGGGAYPGQEKTGVLTTRSVNLLSGNVAESSTSAKSLRQQGQMLSHALVPHPTSMSTTGSLLSSSSSVHDDPFTEVTKTIHSQARRIKELETHLREQNQIITQLREKVGETQETFRASTNDISNLKDELTRLEKTSAYKDLEIEQAKAKILLLENDRTHMMTENMALTKSLHEEKKTFVLNLKQSTQTILSLQEVRKLPEVVLAHGPCPELLPPKPVDEVVIVNENKELNQQKMNESETMPHSKGTESELEIIIQRLQEENLHFQSLISPMNDIIVACTACKHKLDQLFSPPPPQQEQPPDQPIIMADSM